MNPSQLKVSYQQGLTVVLLRMKIVSQRPSKFPGETAGLELIQTNLTNKNQVFYHHFSVEFIKLVFFEILFDLQGFIY